MLFLATVLIRLFNNLNFAMYSYIILQITDMLDRDQWEHVGINNQWEENITTCHMYNPVVTLNLLHILYLYTVKIELLK